MSAKFYILILAAAFFCVSCALEKSESTNLQKPEVVIDDGYKTNEKNEIIIEDKDLKYIQRLVATSEKSTVEKPVIASDGSRITVMSDGYGNKSIQRTFSDHPRVDLILMRVSAKGQKQIFVYAQNGEIKELPGEMQEKVLSGSADDLARSAGIFEGKRPTAQNYSFTPAQTASTPPQEYPVAQPTVEPRPVLRETPAPTAPNALDSTGEKPNRSVKNLSEDLQDYLPKKSFKDN